MPTSKRKETAAAESTTEQVPYVAPPSDETDVQPAKDMETGDGKGKDPVPPSDFDSFATEGVHAEDKTVDELADEVLRGSWGDHSVARGRLDDAGHNSSEVLKRVNERLVGGAPAAYRASAIQLVEQVRRGEWGKKEGLHRRLTSAGIDFTTANDVVTKVEND